MILNYLSPSQQQQHWLLTWNAPKQTSESQRVWNLCLSLASDYPSGMSEWLGEDARDSCPWWMGRRSGGKGKEGHTCPSDPQPLSTLVEEIYLQIGCFLLKQDTCIIFIPNFSTILLYFFLYLFNEENYIVFLLLLCNVELINFKDVLNT